MLKFIIAVMFLVFLTATTPLHAKPKIDENEFKQCMALSDKVDRKKEMLEKRRRELERSKARVDNMRNELNTKKWKVRREKMAYRGCKVQRTINYKPMCFAEKSRYNNAVRSYRSQLRTVQSLEKRHNRKVRSLKRNELRDENRAIDKYNEECVNIRAPDSVIDRQCDGVRDNFFCESFD